ncbi:MAG TPA: hypothetical protein PLO67_04495 [Saprospiraceae bacterium]|nr:hypothetical protein [Saprospiraceae bacterium]
MNRTFILFFLMLTLVIQKNAAQQAMFGQTGKGVIMEAKYKVWVRTDKAVPVAGILYETGDSSVTVMKKVFHWRREPISLETIPVKNIRAIKTRVRWQPLGGMMLGALAGGVIGGLIVKSSVGSCQNCLFPEPGFGTFFGTTLGSSAGILAGGVAGSLIRKKITLSGRQDTYNLQREKIKKLSVTGR